LSITFVALPAFLINKTVIINYLQKKNEKESTIYLPLQRGRLVLVLIPIFFVNIYLLIK